MVADEKISLTLLQSSRWRRDITPSSLSTSKLIWSCSSHGVRVTDEDPATVPILLKNANIDTTTDKPKRRSWRRYRFTILVALLLPFLTAPAFAAARAALVASLD